jgi:hypothetical protein
MSHKGGRRSGERSREEEDSRGAARTRRQRGVTLGRPMSKMVEPYMTNKASPAVDTNER